MREVIHEWFPRYRALSSLTEREGVGEKDKISVTSLIDAVTKKPDFRIFSVPHPDVYNIRPVYPAASRASTLPGSVQLTNI